MPERKQSDLDELGDFLKNHYEKFAIMGIFGTVTLFFTAYWPGGSMTPAARVGTVASLLIFGLSALWLSFKSCREILAASGRWPGISELGYAIIFVGTFALGVTVAAASELYSTAYSVMGEFVLVIILILVFSRVYPGELDLPRQDEPAKYTVETTIALFSAIALIEDVYADTLRAWTKEALGLEIVIFAPLAVMGGFLFFAFRESIIGVTRIPSSDMSDPKVRIQGEWRVRTSLAVSVVAVLVLTLFTRHVAKTTIGPNMGYYRVLGLPAAEFTIAHWLGIATVFSFLVLLDRAHESGSRLIKRIAQAVATLTVVLVIAELVWFVPNGVHTIPL